jgi:hypothetical protein
MSKQDKVFLRTSRGQVAKIIKEEIQKIVAEQGIDPVTGGPVTIGGQAQQAVLKAFRVDCASDPGALAQLFVTFIKKLSTSTHNAFGDKNEKSTYWPYSYYFREAFDACPQATQSLPQGGKELTNLPKFPPEDTIGSGPDGMMQFSVGAILELLKPDED